MRIFKWNYWFSKAVMMFTFSVYCVIANRMSMMDNSMYANHWLAMKEMAYFVSGAFFSTGIGLAINGIRENKTSQGTNFSNV